jgi:hypothetical protein
MDLIDMGEDNRSQGYRYIWHCQCHFSKYNFSGLLVNKTAAEVGFLLDNMFAQTGPIKILQCDNGGEFKARVLELCNKWKMDPPTNSTPYTPTTNGLVERAGGTLQVAIGKWMDQFQTRDWAECVAPLTYQINCTVAKSTKRTPHELVYGRRPRWDSVPIECALDATTLLAIMEGQDEPELTGTDLLQSPPPESAALALLHMNQEAADQSKGDRGTDSAATSQSVTGELGRTPQYLARTPKALTSADAAAAVAVAVTVTRETNAAAVAQTGVQRPLQGQERLQEAQATQGKLLADDSTLLDEPATVSLSEYPDHWAVRDLLYGALGPISKSVAQELDGGPAKFFRLGTTGAGRCLLSAWLGTDVEGTSAKAVNEMKADCDSLRARLKAWLLQLPVKRRNWLSQQLLHCGNSGLEGRGDEEEAGLAQQASGGLQQCWDTLLRHLDDNSADLGWECLVVLSEMERVNVLVYCHLEETKRYDGNTQLAALKWREAEKDGIAQSEAARQGKFAPGGSWMEESCKPQSVLVPRRLNENWPFRVIFHRTQIVHYHRKHADGKEVGNSEGGRGHYESLVANTAADGEPASYLGTFQAGSTIHAHLCHIGNCYLAAQYNDLARVRMETAYNELASVVQYKVLHAVGLRMAAALKKGKRGAARGTDVLPCIVIRVLTHAGGGSSGSQAAPTQHEQYKLLCEFGVINGSWKVDALVPVNLRNFPQLVRRFDEFSAAELVMPTHVDYQPIDESRYELVSAEEAWEKHCQKKTPAVRNNKRRRAAESRTTAVAAETAIVTAKVDRRKAPSLFTTSSQPTPATARSSEPSHVISIIGHNATEDRFKAVWSGTPTDWQWCRKNYLLGACPEVLAKYAENAKMAL